MDEIHVAYLLLPIIPATCQGEIAYRSARIIYHDTFAGLIGKPYSGTRSRTGLLIRLDVFELPRDEGIRPLRYTFHAFRVILVIR